MFYKGQVWRVLTSFFFLGPFSMGFIFGMVMIYYSIKSIETYFDRRQADFATLLSFNAVAALLVAYLANDYTVM